MFIKNACYLIECKVAMKGHKRDNKAIKKFEDEAYKLGALTEQFGVSVKPYLFTRWIAYA